MSVAPPAALGMITCIGFVGVNFGFSAWVAALLLVGALLAFDASLTGLLHPLTIKAELRTTEQNKNADLFFRIITFSSFLLWFYYRNKTQSPCYPNDTLDFAILL
jgi:hypothetical protein